MAKKQKNYRTDKKSDSARKAKPSGYRYNVHDKDHPKYYSRPTAIEIKKHLAGEGKWKDAIYYEARVERGDKNQKKKLEKGGDIPNNYEGKSPQEIWDKWNGSQRLHFLVDHTERKQYTPATQEELSKKTYKFLPTDFKQELNKHVDSGQYVKGGEINTQEEAYDYLKKNKMLVGFAGDNSMPFDKTTNYKGIVQEIEAHRKLHGTKKLLKGGWLSKLFKKKEAKPKKEVKPRKEWLLEMFKDDKPHDSMRFDSESVANDTAKTYRDKLGYKTTVTEVDYLMKDGGDVTGKTKTIHGISHSIMREPIKHDGLLMIESSHPLGVVYSDGKYGYVQDGNDFLRFSIVDLDDIKKKMKNGGSVDCIVTEYPRGFKGLTGKGNAYRIAKYAGIKELIGIPVNKDGSIEDDDSEFDIDYRSFDDEEAKEFISEMETIFGDDIKNVSPIKMMTNKKSDGGTMTLDTHGKAVTIIDASKMSTEDIVKKELKEMGKIHKQFLRKLLGRDLNYHETVGEIKLRKPYLCSYFVEIK